jgi:hypothetical protein
MEEEIGLLRRRVTGLELLCARDHTMLQILSTCCSRRALAGMRSSSPPREDATRLGDEIVSTIARGWKGLVVEDYNAL